MEKYTFKMPIGDWSADGHNEVIYYRVESNKPVEEVREIHFKIKSELGIDIEGFANEYEDSTIPLVIVDKLIDLGVSVDDDLEYVSRYDMFVIWKELLMLVDKELTLKQIDSEPMLPFYGFDKKGRSIGTVGYGTF
jgi:hypothetical protein